MSVPGSEQQPDGSSGASLSIGDVAERAGVSPGLLRMWEQRFGFPQPTRLPSGHRRYSDADVESVREVLARQEAGLRLDRAVAAVQALRRSGEPSVFAAVRAADPRLPRQRLRKSTLVALSHAIEDEMCARGRQGFAFGAFQQASFYAASERRWRDIARRSRLTVAFADFPDARPPRSGGRAQPILVPLSGGDPLREEWAVVCDSPAFAAVLSAWEPPGQSSQPDREREFEAVWTLDPAPVRAAARVCLDLAEAGGVPDVADLRSALASSPTATPPTPQVVTDFCDRVIGELDRRSRR